MTTSKTPLRIVQWATGNIGLRSMREVIRHPGMELVGALTYNPDKAGVDAGELCGESLIGVKMTTDRAKIHDLKADCVIYMPRIVDIEDLVAFAEAGTNIVSICMEIYDGCIGLDDQGRVRLEEACRRGGTSVYGTGSSPGFITDIFPFALLSLQPPGSCARVICRRCSPQDWRRINSHPDQRMRYTGVKCRCCFITPRVII